jgi:branched-chain amino acid transport system ATP-binding protein
MPDERAAAAPAQAPAAGKAPLLAVRELNAWYGESHVLHGVAFDVAAGEVVTLLGRNGAGKTTTLRSIMGIVPRRAGSIVFEGEEIVALASNRIAQRGIAYCPRSAASSRASTSRRICCCRRRSRRRAVGRADLRALSASEGAAHSQGTKLSGGEQQMLAIGRILRTGARLCCSTSPPRAWRR